MFHLPTPGTGHDRARLSWVESDQRQNHDHQEQDAVQFEFGFDSGRSGVERDVCEPPSRDEGWDVEEMTSARMIQAHDGAAHYEPLHPGPANPPTVLQKMTGLRRTRSQRLGSVRRTGSQRIGSLRRTGSKRIAEIVHSVDPLAPKGNPLDIGINEQRQVSADPQDTSAKFVARRSLVLEEDLSVETILDTSEEISRAKGVPFGRVDPVESYTIKRLAKFDDVEFLSTPKRMIYRTSPILNLAAIIANGLYLVLRAHFTVLAQRAAHTIYYMAWTFIVVELLVSIPMLLHRFWGLHSTGSRQRPKLRLVGDNVPSVDVVITCCGEEGQLILDTAKAACNVDYPQARFRVIVCDDGRSETLREMVEDTARTQFDNLYYRSRPRIPGVPHHFKAGNLNYALEETEKFEGGSAHFLAALDADMIPERDWLRALLPHLLQDPKCSMACPPQLFYNVPKDDPLCQSLDVFVHVSEPLKDSLGVAWCTGSGYILRRKALADIGGFPIGSLAEDVCCSSMLLGSGWNTVFVHEPLQFGTVPESLASHLKQRTRWTIGTIQTAYKLRFSLYGPLVKHMTFFQRLCGFIYTFGSFFTIFLVMSMFTAPIVLVSGGTMVPYSTMNQLRWLMRSCFLSMALNRINEFISYLPSGYHIGQREERAMFWMAPFNAIAVVRTFLLPRWLGGKVAVFTSSGSQKAELNERDGRLRAPLWRRLKVTLYDCSCWIHLVYICFVIAAVAAVTYRNIRDNRHTSLRATLIALLTHAGWPPMIWLTCSLSAFVPLRYAVMPPTVPDREDLLDRDHKTGIAYPSAAAKKQHNSVLTWVHELRYSALSLYTTFIFVMSFLI